MAGERSPADEWDAEGPPTPSELRRLYDREASSRNPTGPEPIWDWWFTSDVGERGTWTVFGGDGDGVAGNCYEPTAILITACHHFVGELLEALETGPVLIDQNGITRNGPPVVAEGPPEVGHGSEEPPPQPLGSSSCHATPPVPVDPAP